MDVRSLLFSEVALLQIFDFPILQACLIKQLMRWFFAANVEAGRAGFVSALTQQATKSVI